MWVIGYCEIDPVCEITLKLISITRETNKNNNNKFLKEYIDNCQGALSLKGPVKLTIVNYFKKCRKVSKDQQ